MSRCDDWAEGWEEGRQQGEADMLAKCIETITGLPWSSENWIDVDERIPVLAALRALGKPSTTTKETS